MKTLFFYLVIIFSVSANNYLFSQNNNLRQNLNTDSKVKIQSVIFNDIESGINNSDVKKFSPYFSSQPYISLINGLNGYYSSNQAYYIIEDFFNSFKVVSFVIVMRSLGSSAREFKKGAEGITDDIEEATNSDPRDSGAKSLPKS